MTTKRWLAGLAWLLLALVGSSGLLLASDYTPDNLSGGWVRRVVEAPSPSAGTFYAVSYGIFKSTDSGQTWTRKPYGDPPAAVLAANGGQVFGRHCTNSVAVSSGNASLVIAGDEQWSPIWRSTDGGDTWTCVTLGSESYSNWKRTSMVAASLKDTNTFFAAIEPQIFPDGPSAATLYMSTDGGQTWNTTGFTVSNGQTITDVVQIPSGPNAGRIVVSVIDTYLGFNRDNAPFPMTGHIYYSGTSDTNFVADSTINTPAAKMAWDSSNYCLWMISYSGDIYSSTDGVNWTLSTTIPNATPPTCHRPVGIVAGPNGSLLAFINQGVTPAVVIYQKAVGSSSWQQVTMPAVGSNEQVIEGFTNDLVFNSTDINGTTWGIADCASGFFYMPNAMTGSAAHFTRSTGICSVYLYYGLKDSATNREYAVGEDGIYYSADNGTSWNSVYPKIDGVRDMCSYAAFDPTSTSIVYAIAFHKIYFTTNNGGDNFGGSLTYFNGLSSTQNLTNLIIDPTAKNPNQTMFIGVGNQNAVASTGSYLYKSINSGSSWTAVNVPTLPANHGIYCLAMDPSNSSILYAGCGDNDWAASNFNGHGEGLWKSTDGGGTWNKINGLDNVRICQVAIDPTNTQNLLVGYVAPAPTNCGAKFSSDGGAHWLDVVIDNGTGQTRDQMPKFGDNKAFFVGDTIYAGDASGTIYYGLTASQGIVKLATVTPTAVSWIFKGSVLAATGSGLLSLTLPAATLAPAAGGNAGNPGNGTPTPTTVNLAGKAVVAYPNPGKDQINFAVNISKTSDVKIDLFNMKGERVVSLKDTLNPSSPVLTWDCAGVGPGVYIARVSVAGSETAKIKVAVIKP